MILEVTKIVLNKIIFYGPRIQQLCTKIYYVAFKKNQRPTTEVISSLDLQIVTAEDWAKYGSRQISVWSTYELRP
jgi:hypothetical protein